MKRKAVLIAIAVLVLASTGCWIYIRHSKARKQQEENTYLSLLIAGEQTKRDPGQEIPLGSAKEGVPLSSPEDAPEYCRDLMKEPQKYAYRIYDSPDLVIVEKAPLTSANYSILYTPERLRSSQITDRIPVNSFILEKGKDILWLKSPQDLVVWEADLSDNLRSANKRDTVYDAQDGKRPVILSLVTDSITVMHSKERLVADTLVKTTDDNRAVLLRQTLKEYLRSFNINKEDPVPVKGTVNGNRARVFYSDNKTEEYMLTQ